MTSPHAAVTAWPVPKVGTGPALNKRGAGKRLGRSLSAVEAMIRRTKAGAAKERFPEPSGYAFDPESEREVMVPFWWEREIVGYGKRANILDKRGFVIERKATPPKV